MEYLIAYIPIAIIVVISIGFAAANLLINYVVGPSKDNVVKDLPYESGMIPKGDANVRIPIKFYMVAILFLLFDIESIFMIAWAVIFQFPFDFQSETIPFSQSAFQLFAFVEMLTFIMILLVGYAYVWRKGGFEWS